MSKFAIVIPIYKPVDKIDRLEEINFERFCRFLDKDSEKYDIICLSYENEFYDGYNKKYNLFNQIYKAGKTYFSNVATYSFFMCCEMLYKTLQSNGYDYVYILQTDVLILKNDFEYWVDYCREHKIDYIGGPIVSWHTAWDIIPKTKEEAKHMPDISKCKVGNGGFSLRNVNTMVEVTDHKREYFKTYIDNETGDLTYNILANKLTSYKHSIMEDMYFCLYVAARYPLHIATVEEALKFSWDYNPDRCYELNHNELPMCCHAPQNSMAFYKNLKELDVYTNEDWITDEKIKEWHDNFIDKLNNAYKIVLNPPKNTNKEKDASK